MSDKNEIVVHFLALYSSQFISISVKRTAIETPEGLLLKRRLIIAASLFVLIYRLVLRRKTFLFHLNLQDSCRVLGIDGLHHRSDSHRGNEHQQRNPASLTKLMTGYVGIALSIVIALRRTILSPWGVCVGER